MATITDVVTASSTTSGATLAVTPITAAVGDWLVLCVAADNAGTAGASSTSAAITDAAGNTWTRQSVTVSSPGGATSDGATLSIWTCKVTSALAAASITVNFSPNTICKAAALKKIAPGIDDAISVYAVGAGATGSGLVWDAPTVSVPQGYTIFGAVAVESTTAATADSDTTNGSWSTDQTAIASTGTVGTSQSLGVQHKTVNASGNQTYGRSNANARDWAANYIIISYVASGTASGTSTVSAAPLLEGSAQGVATASANVTTFRGRSEGVATALGIPLLDDTTIVSFATTEPSDRIAILLAPGWPTLLPIPTLQGYSFSPASAVERRALEFGAPRVYRRTKQPPIDLGVMWQLDAEQQALLDYFQNDVLRQGHHQFAITLALPSGVATAVARFKDKIAIRARGGPRWQTTATLELLTRPMMTDEELTLLLDDEGDPPAWPDALPQPTLQSWELNPKPAVVRTSDLPGLPQQRQRSRNSITEVSAAWELSADQAALFDAFFHWRGKDGAQWFAFPLVQAVGTVDTKVRFLGDADWMPRGAGRWAVTAPIEIRERTILPEVI